MCSYFIFFIFFLGSIFILWHEKNDSPADNFMFLKINFIWLSLWSETLESHQLIILFYLSWNKIYTFMSMLDICYSNSFTSCIMLYIICVTLHFLCWKKPYWGDFYYISMYQCLSEFIIFVFKNFRLSCHLYIIHFHKFSPKNVYMYINITFLISNSLSENILHVELLQQI